MGSTKKFAEQDAARSALELLERAVAHAGDVLSGAAEPDAAELDAAEPDAEIGTGDEENSAS
jgi:hypothetical protein